MGKITKNFNKGLNYWIEFSINVVLSKCTWSVSAVHEIIIIYRKYIPIIFVLSINLSMKKVHLIWRKKLKNWYAT